MRVGALLVAIAAALAGCHQPETSVVYTYSKPGATNEQYQKDRFECIQASQIRVGAASYGAYGGYAASNVRVDRGTMVSCLASRGYALDANGQFGPPPGGKVEMVN
jgi:outer membrane lipoprotein SlyB